MDLERLQNKTEKPTEPSTLLGDCLRIIRLRQGLTLMEVSKKTGIAVSTISKVENHQMSLTYDKLLQLANGLEVGISELFSPDHHTRGMAWRSYTPANAGPNLPTANYNYRYLCADLPDKKMIPITATVRASTIEEFGDFIRHSGEEFIYVLSGSIVFYSEFYKPLPMAMGSSVYFDARMGHAYVKDGTVEAEILCLCSAPEAELDSVVSRQTSEQS